ncbi:sacsin [Mytilus galloprovincialis]|nr:sacsin [Mytilus galloprovincialis]
MEPNDDDDSSDASGDDGPVYSSMKQPPLIKQLKKILDEYPDDGQILKEIIQNAEDAEASEMKVLFDGRSVNDGSVEEKPFTKYFKGPALCVYNNAQFTEEDWEGIQMINSSVKEFDSVKIGRYGLGFKSVFHITDYPMIISKNKMLILDPHQTTPERVCILMKLKKLDRYTEMDILDCLSALEGIFGFSKDTLKSGKFTGTFFRFPLRSKPTLLSDNVYDEAKIGDLFRAFQSEASVELLFLKCLERIELYTKNVSELPSGEDLPIFTVNISDSCIHDVRKKRKQLYEVMKSVQNSLAEKSFMTSYNMKIKMKELNEQHTENEWYVMHFYKGGDMSKELKTLSQDETLSYSPYVSLGLPLFHDPEFKGHVFCLMPLPLQNESLTGFPVHVNGYFALTQNRRHVKWPTADQTKNKAHMDKTIRWNKCLVIEVLAEAYQMLINETIKMSNSNNNVRDKLQITYTCIPDHRTITNDWAIILNPLYSRLLQTTFLYTENNGGNWIKSEDAVFNIFNEDTPEDVKETVVRLVDRYNVNLVNVPEHVTSMIRHRDHSVQKLTQKFILNFLKTDAKYKKMTSNEKLDILHFILSARKSLSLVGLELLPLQNGSFTLFGNRGRDKQIIVCQEEMELFPGQEDVFCKHGLQTELYRLLVQMAENNEYQLCTMQDLSTDDIATLLLGTIRKYNGKTTDHALPWKTSTSTVAGKKWLTNVWKFLQSYDIDDFCNLHLLPSCSQGKDFLYKLSTKVLLKTYHGYTDLPDAVCKALSYLSIVTVDTLPKSIINHDDINKIIYFPTVENVFNMLEDVTLQRNSGQAIQKFNKTCTEKERTEFAKYIATSSYFSSNVTKFISKLQIFKEKNSGRSVSSSEVNVMAETEELPIKYQKESLVYSGHFHKALLNLQVPTRGMEEVVIDIMDRLQRGSIYSHNEMNLMMKFVMNKFKTFENQLQILDIARNIKFVTNGRGEMKKAKELFDPEDADLKWIIIDQARFPNMTKCPITLKQVRKLGLKTGCEVNANDILECAKYIESKPNEDAQDRRSSQLFDFLQKNPQLLRSITGQTNLSEKLMNVHFIKPSCRMENFPDMLPWFESSFSFCKPSELIHHQFVLLIGSVQPVIQKDVTPELCRVFSWKKAPTIKSVIEQLFIIIRLYEDKYKPHLLPLINQIYNFLSVNYSRASEVTPLKSEKWIWTGFGFEPSCNIVIETKDSDILLQPYLFSLPPEFRTPKLIQFFSRMNCVNCQDTDLLLRVLQMIQDKYEGGYQNERESKSDLHLCMKILNSLKECDDIDEKVLIPVHTYTTGRVILKPANECNYCNDDWLKGAAEEDGDEIYYVHPDISHDTAVKLGVPSLTDKLLEDTEGIEEWGQTEPLTRRIKNLIKDYKDGLSVPKEIVQNADDAGAKKVTFMYDERENKQFRTKLLDCNMAKCQGPALWAYNDATFSQKDFENITKLSGATKEDDSSKIGKFGLGFCSVYNLTEVPSFVSGNQIVIFDPHTTYLGSALRNKNQPGIKIDTRTNQSVLKRMKSQFEPYNEVFGCNLNPEKGNMQLNGTLFRFPLRTEEQARAPSEISDKVYNRKEMVELIEIFVKACGNLLLFTQNVNEIEFYHLPATKTDPREAVLLYSAHRKLKHTIEKPFGKSIYTGNEITVLRDMAESLRVAKRNRHHELMTISKSILQEILINADNNLKGLDITGYSSKSTWLVTWASGVERSKMMALNSRKKGVLPLGSVACLLEKQDEDTYSTSSLEKSPFGFYQNSHLFCYLPLPVESKFPVHINGSFAVSSDRRRLSCKTTDDKDSFDSEWNEALISDAICRAYITFLEHLPNLTIDPNEHYFKQWPVEDMEQGIFALLKESFYRTISDTLKQPVVFRRGDKSVCLNRSKFLDPVLMEAEFSEKAFQMCIEHFENDEITIIRLPKNIGNCFKNYGCDSAFKERILSVVSFYSVVVFPFLTSSNRDSSTNDQLILFALDVCRRSEDLFHLMKSTCCIPTAPNRLFRCPNETIDRHGLVGPLFEVNDERFVDLTDMRYDTQERLDALYKLGMITGELSDKMVIDRAHSIQTLANTDLTRGLDRCRKFVSYIYKHRANVMSNEKLLTELQAIKFLPVKTRPRHWKIIWGGEKLDSTEQACSKIENECIPLLFECPTNLHSESILELVCSLEPVLDRSSLQYGIDHQFIKELGVKEEDGVDLKTILENLKTICRCFDEKDPVADELDILDKTTMKTYKYLDKTFKQNAYDDEQLEEILQVAAAYSGEKLILLNGQFIQPCQLFLDLSEDCSPYLYGLNTAVHLRTLKGFMNLMGIHEQCSVETTMQVLSSIQERNESNDMSEDAVRVYVKLLRVLVQANKREQLPKQKFQSLYIPDTKGVLTHVSKLCVDEVNITSLGRMKFTHPSISFDIAFALGINSKREQKIEECSKPIEMFSKDFGQHEELITRIKRILSGYPCDAGVLKELLQNADDAKASEVHIVIDYNNHETDNLFSDSWKPLQGPAILIYNDSSFSEADIRGIQKLGIGSKGEDPTKTGQYGVGFNAVYHLTDVPSFLTKGDNVETGEILCMMDPHCQFVPKATPESPGRKYFQTEILKTDYPNVFKCYHEDLIMKEHGTIFRLPLRTSTLAAKSKISSKDINESFIRRLIENFQEEMSEILLFVNNVKTVRLSEIVDGMLKEKYTVTVEMTESDEENRRHFYNELHSCSGQIGQTKNPDCIKISEVKYKININDTFGKQKNWIIVRRIGFPVHSPESVLEAYRQDELGVLPRGGVAVLLPSEEKVLPSKGRAFCFLPLPLDTGMPVHINGHFVLDHEARRNLWTEEKEGYRSAWNKTLLRNVIAPAYASALHLVKDNIGLKEGASMMEEEVRKLNDMYHTFWPEVCKASNEYFKFFVMSVYQWIFQNEESLFLSYKLMREAKVAVVKFHPLICSEMMFPCVFNTLTDDSMPHASLELVSSVSQRIEESIVSLQSQISVSETKRQNTMQNLVRLVKDIGIKLLDSPKTVLKSLKEAEVEVTEMSPTFLISFLKSFDSENTDRCYIGNMGEAIEDTNFRSVENLVTCIKYCKQSQSFEDEIEGLPLCLTNDRILRVFSNVNPVFRSQYCYILKESARSFLHSELVTCISSTLTGIKPFTIDAFSELLFYTLAAETYRTHRGSITWKPKIESIPNKPWIEAVWKFLNAEVQDHMNNCKQDTPVISSDTVLTLLRPVLPWCLMPCIEEPLNEKFDNYKPILTPIDKSMCVLDIESFSGDLRKALEILYLPCIDNLVAPSDRLILDYIIVNANNPGALLNFLYQHKTDINNRRISVRNCYEIMGFICEHLDMILECDEDIKIDQIKSIPLHSNVNGHNIDIIGHSSILVLDSAVSRDIVVDGIEEWASSSGTILLKTSTKLKKMYARMGLTNENLKAIDVYTDYLLPKFQFLPRHVHLKHLEYIQNNLLAKSFEFDKRQKDLITVLENVVFVPDKQNVLYKASHFKNPFNDLMQLMCSEDDFPGKPFDDLYWKYLLETAGIQNEITKKLILEFARIIEHLGRIQVTEEVINKSAMLIEYVLNRYQVEREGILEDISGIKFIVPHTVEPWKSDIFRQPETKLICFRNSVFEEHSDICWTACTILPYFANPQFLHTKPTKIRNKMLQQLQVHKEPSLDNVIQHTQNVSDSLKLLANQNSIHDKHVMRIEEVLIQIYAWLLKYKDSNSEKLKRSLLPKPIIFLPKSKLFVTCERVVKSLQVEEIRPYLMEVPEQYGAYFKLFELLGMNTRENICNFVRVLAYLKLDVKNEILHVNELLTVRKALQGICNHLPSLNDELKTDLTNIDALYLPTRDKYLANARQIVLSDNRDYEEKIGNDIGMPYMMYLNELNVVGVGNIVSDFKKMPSKLQPHILSDMISKELNAESLTVRFDEKGRLFRDFIVTPQFLEAAVRIAVHCRDKRAYHAKETEIDVDKIITSIENLQIMQVDMVQLKLVFGSNIVGYSEESCYYYTKTDVENETDHVLLCCFKDLKITKWVAKNSRTISRALQSCSNYEFIDTEGLLFIVLDHLKNPDEISRALDKEDISRYSISHRCRTSIFPPAGTYVHSDWHCYLDNSFSNFEVGEYVALLLNEESIENDTFIPALYIYAIIVQKFEEASPSSLLDSTLCMYEVDVGERKERKRAYDLYKFNRSTQESSTELAPFLNIADSPIDDRNLDDILKEVKEILKAAWTLPEDERRKVVRRLYKKWHPDKNIGNEDFAKKVCQFLQQIVFKLESGQDIDSDSSSTFEPSTGSNFYSHFRTWDRDARHDSNRNKRRRGRRGGGSGHSRRQPSEPVPSCHESRQWIRQAKIHLTGAIEFLPKADIGPNFNSICMICYQSVEIALKAVYYRTDANKIPETKNISELVARLDGDLKTLVEKLATLVGKPERMIYPDKLNIPKIPSQMYSKDTATRAVEVTKTILDFISDRTLS